MQEEKSLEFWERTLKTVLLIPTVKINRAEYLKSELSKWVSDEKVDKAINTTPAKANIDKKLISKIADSCIKNQSTKVAGISFLIGLPGGPWGWGTIPVDVAQFYAVAIQLIQKLIYLYGWPELFDEKENDYDEETLYILSVFIGVMMGQQVAIKGLNVLASKLAEQVIKRIPRMALTKYGLYVTAKETAKWIGVEVTKKGLARAMGRIIPLVSGILAGTLSLIIMINMGNKLKKHLAELILANE